MSESRPPPEDPNTQAIDSEPLLGNTACRLFGRVFAGLTLNAPEGDSRIDKARHPILARIYGFSWQGNYFKLAVPTVMMVYGGGREVPSDLNGAKIGQIGIEFKDEFFSGDVRMWLSYDTEFAVRIDIASGWLSEILITPEASDATNVTGAGDGVTDGRSRVLGRASLAARASMVGRPPNS